MRERLSALESGVAGLAQLSAETQKLRDAYIDLAADLSKQREVSARKLEAAIAVELPPLKLERARFVVETSALPEAQWGPRGTDAIRFLISTNPGELPGALDKIASGGELSRLMLAMKVVLSAGSDNETLIFDEVDSGIGGATAAAVGERLARVADEVQVLVVTHSPQVAARAHAQMRVQKLEIDGRAVTDVKMLNDEERREEIARMLSGESVTQAARQAAESLLTK